MVHCSRGVEGCKESRLRAGVDGDGRIPRHSSVLLLRKRSSRGFSSTRNGRHKNDNESGVVSHVFFSGTMIGGKGEAALSATFFRAQELEATGNSGVRAMRPQCGRGGRGSNWRGS